MHSITLLIILSFGTMISFMVSDKSVEVIDKAVEAYGGSKFSNSKIQFTFRNRDYSIVLNNGIFEYKRITRSNSEVTEDVLNNEGFSRIVDGEKSILSKLYELKYSSSVNSVVYFALLPYKLKDKAVQSEYLDKVNIKGRDYHKIRVTFSKEAGGEDYEDVFVYWFSTVDYSMDYMAYSYKENDIGLRFRKAYNKREINGLVFQDYENYKADYYKNKVEELDKRFENGELELLSKIELENISVK